MSLGVIGIRTRTGARYEFPDMKLADVDPIINHAKSGDSCSQIALHNVSQSVLVVPWKIVDEISMDGEVKWKRSQHP